MKHRLGRSVPIFIATLCTGVPALAAGFSFSEQSAKASGQAGAWIARADDASASWYNPAALVYLNGGEVDLGVSWLNPGNDTTFTINDASAEAAAASLGVTVVSGQQFDATANSMTPAHLYYGQKINSKWAFGIGINNPFGLVSEWEQIPMTLSSKKSEVYTYQVNPNIAYRVNDRWSFAFGVDYLTAEVRQFSSDQYVSSPPSTVGVNFTGEGDSWGYNLAVEYKTKCLALAATYRSDVNPEIRGRFEVAPPLSSSSSDASATLNLPGTLSMGVAWMSNRVDVEFAANYTQWNRFKDVAIESSSGGTIATLQESWKDVWAYRLGVAIRLGGKMAHELRVGGVRDQSPIPTRYLRPSIPDSDRTGVTLGYGYSAKKWGVDVYVMNVNFDDITATGDFNSDGVIQGSYSSSIVVGGVTGKIRF